MKNKTTQELELEVKESVETSVVDPVKEVVKQAPETKTTKVSDKVKVEVETETDPFSPGTKVQLFHGSDVYTIVDKHTVTMCKLIRADGVVEFIEQSKLLLK